MGELKEPLGPCRVPPHAAYYKWVWVRGHGDMATIVCRPHGDLPGAKVLAAGGRPWVGVEGLGSWGSLWVGATVVVAVLRAGRAAAGAWGGGGDVSSAPRGMDVVWGGSSGSPPGPAVVAQPPSSPCAQHSRWMMMPSRRAMRKRRTALIRATQSQVNLQSARYCQPACTQSCRPGEGEESGQSRVLPCPQPCATPRAQPLVPRVPAVPHASPHPHMEHPMGGLPVAPRTRVHVQTPCGYRGHPGVMWLPPHPRLVAAQLGAPPGAPRPRRRGCRTQSARKQRCVALWGAALWRPIGWHPRPSPTSLRSTASGQSMISVKSFMVAALLVQST